MQTKYSKPIDQEDFWKNRLEGAKKMGEVWRSVYDTDAETWKKIGDVHYEIISNLGIQGNILDVGCGYGRMSEFFPSTSNNYVGVDFVPAFIAEAKEKYADRTFAVMDAKDMSEFTDKTFDLAVCVSMKRMIVDNSGWEEWGKFETEIRRVSKAILILEYSTPEDYEVIYERA